MIDRRAFLRASLFVAAAPIIVKASSMMVLPHRMPVWTGPGEFDGSIDFETGNYIGRAHWRGYSPTLGSFTLGLGFCVPRNVDQRAGVRRMMPALECAMRQAVAMRPDAVERPSTWPITVGLAA